MSPASAVLLGLIAAGAISMLAARLTDARALVMPLILLASTSYVALGVASGGLRTAFGRVTLCGLACCWIGDAIGPGNFLFGLGAFLAGHIFFAVSFAIHGIAPRRTVVAFGVVFAVSAAVGALLWPHVPAAERVPFTAYCTVISIMLVTAASVRPGLPLALPAAALFYVSDVCVALWRYADSAIDGYLCYLLYYAACALFALNARHAAATAPGNGHDERVVDFGPI